VSNNDHPRRKHRASNPQGRMDILFARIIDRLMETHPAVTTLHKALYYSFKNDLQSILTSNIGPRTNAGRTVSKLVAGTKQAGVIR
jgi:hypothetical protein